MGGLLDMWPFDYFRKKMYVVVAYGDSGDEARQRAHEKLPFPLEPMERMYQAYQERVTGMYSLDTLTVSEFEAEVTFTLTKLGKKVIQMEGLEDSLVLKKGK